MSVLSPIRVQERCLCAARNLVSSAPYHAMNYICPCIGFNYVNSYWGGVNLALYTVMFTNSKNESLMVRETFKPQQSGVRKVSNDGYNRFKNEKDQNSL